MSEPPLAPPETRPDDDEDVAWALQTASTLWARGERADALVWLRRAAESATRAGQDFRASEIGLHASAIEEAMRDEPSEEPPAIDDGRMSIEIEPEMFEEPSSDGPPLPRPAPPPPPPPSRMAPPRSVAPAAPHIPPPAATFRSVAPTARSVAPEALRPEPPHPAVPLAGGPQVPAPQAAAPQPPAVQTASAPQPAAPQPPAVQAAASHPQASTGEAPAADPRRPEPPRADAPEGPRSEAPRPQPPRSEVPRPATARPPAPKPWSQPPAAPLDLDLGGDVLGPVQVVSASAAEPARAAAPEREPAPPASVRPGEGSAAPAPQAAARADDTAPASQAPLSVFRSFAGVPSTALGAAAGGSAGPRPAVRRHPRAPIFDPWSDEVPADAFPTDGAGVEGAAWDDSAVITSAGPLDVLLRKRPPPPPPRRRQTTVDISPSQRPPIPPPPASQPDGAAAASAAPSPDEASARPPASVPRPSAAPAAPGSPSSATTTPRPAPPAAAAPAPAAEPVPAPSAAEEPAPAAAPRQVSFASLSIGGLPLERAESLSDLPPAVQAALLESAEIVELAAEEERADFGVLLVLSGEIAVCATVVDAPAARFGVGALVPSRGSFENGVATRAVAFTGPARVARWEHEIIRETLRSCPWVVDELDERGDRIQARVGATLGPLGDLDDATRTSTLDGLTVRAFVPGERVVARGAPGTGVMIVGGGSVEVVGDAARETLGCGDPLFATEALSGSPAPGEAHAGAGGALVLMADRRGTQALVTSLPMLLEMLSTG